MIRGRAHCVCVCVCVRARARARVGLQRNINTMQILQAELEVVQARTVLMCITEKGLGNTVRGKGRGEIYRVICLVIVIFVQTSISKAPVVFIMGRGLFSFPLLFLCTLH